MFSKDSLGSMKTYTLFFPDPVSSQFQLPEGFALGTPLLIDGLATGSLSDGNLIVSLGDGPINAETPRVVFFDSQQPPEIVRGYVLEADILELQKEIFLKRSQNPVRQPDPVQSPILLRISTLCAAETGLFGSLKTAAGSPKLLASGQGFNKYSDEESGIWRESLYELKPGDAVALRPAGLSKVFDWVVQNGETGIVFKSLETFVS